jgi:hypothetical protein
MAEQATTLVAQVEPIPVVEAEQEHIRVVQEPKADQELLS